MLKYFNIKSFPTAWTLPFLLCTPTIIMIFFKATNESAGFLKILGNTSNFIYSLIKQITQFAFIAVIHYWISIILNSTFNISNLPMNIFFYALYVEILALTIYDFEYTRVNMQQTLPSVLPAYVGRFGGDSKSFSQPISNIPNGPVKSAAFKCINESISDSLFIWIQIVIMVIIWLLLQVIFLIFYRNDILYSTYKARKAININYLAVSVKMDMLGYVYHLLAFIYMILLFITFFSVSDTKTSEYSSSPYFECIFLSFTHFEKKLTKQTEKELLSLVRSYLPPGRRWLDNRKDVIYPAVHGDIKAFCAYNKDHKDCKNISANDGKKKLVKKLPNIAFLIYESLTPSYLLINDDFIREHASIGENDPRQLITDTLYYNETIMPNMNRYQKGAITFSGTSSLGLPTSSGWHAMMTGLEPAQTFMNIIDGAVLESDDFPSHLHDSGYRTFHISASLPKFDGTNNWVWRRSANSEAKERLKCKEEFGDLVNDTLMRGMFSKKQFPKLKNCDSKEVEKLTKKLKSIHLDFPQWYDYVYAYNPTKENSVLLGLDPDSVVSNTTWPPDRITAQEFITHWKQNRDILDKNGHESTPIFGSYLSIEPHIPYSGFDLPSFYEDFHIKKGMSKGQKKEKKFLRVNHYADKYQIGITLDWLKENDPNTIFVITGDHGTRDIPIRDYDSPVVDDIVFSSDCVHHSSGVDSFYVTSAMIGYLGDDPVIKEALKLEKLSGKTLKITNDHNDLIYTIKDILNRLNGTSMPPTHQRNRNLVDLMMNVSDGLKTKSVSEVQSEIDNSGWNSFSIITFMAEYREGTSLLRTHTGDPKGAHYYDHVSYPTCLRRKSTPPMKVGTDKAQKMYKKMFKRISAETYLNFHNRLFNYGFRNKKCIEDGDCTFNDPVPLVFSDDFVLSVIFGIPFLLMIFFTFIIEMIGCYKYRNCCLPDEVKLSNDNNLSEYYPTEELLDQENPDTKLLNVHN